MDELVTSLRQALQNTARTKLVINGPDDGFRTFCPAADFIGFDGHFPGYPVLPAMLQIMFGVVVCEELCASKLKLKKLDKAKFMTQIQPGQAITVSCRLTRPTAAESQSTIRARITITTKEQKAASMTLFLERL